MGQDLRKLFEEERKKASFPMKQGHEARFLERLDAELPIKKEANRFLWLKIAASVLVLLTIGAFFLSKGSEDTVTKEATIVDSSNKVETDPNTISLGDLSPDLQKVENYYVANINYELSQLEVSDENKEVVDGYMERLGELDREYITLNTELNELGPNDETISALIQNLQLRLQLLQKLKEKLNQLKSSKNEQEIYSI